MCRKRFLFVPSSRQPLLPPSQESIFPIPARCAVSLDPRFSMFSFFTIATTSRLHGRVSFSLSPFSVELSSVLLFCVEFAPSSFLFWVEASLSDPICLPPFPLSGSCSSTLSTHHVSPLEQRALPSLKDGTSLDNKSAFPSAERLVISFSLPPPQRGEVVSFSFVLQRVDFRYPEKKFETIFCYDREEAFG